MKKSTVIPVLIVLAILGALILGFYLGSRGASPLAVFRHYPVALLSLEACNHGGMCGMPRTPGFPHLPDLS